MNIKTFIKNQIDIYTKAYCTAGPPVIDLRHPTYQALEQEAARQSIRGALAFYESLKTIYDGMEEMENVSLESTPASQPGPGRQPSITE